MDEDDRKLYEQLRDHDKQGPPLNAFHLFSAALGDQVPDAVYAEEAEAGQEWTLWALLGGALVRVTAPPSSAPVADISPLDVRRLSPELLGGDRDNPVWTAEVAGPDGEPLSIGLPGEHQRSFRPQRQAAGKFADALRRAATGRGVS